MRRAAANLCCWVGYRLRVLADWADRNADRCFDAANTVDPDGLTVARLQKETEKLLNDRAGRT